MGHLYGVKILILSVNYRRKLFALSHAATIFINFLHKLYDNKLPIYFNEYMPYLEVRETKYNLRPHPLPVPRVAHAFAESCLLYKLHRYMNMISACLKLVM